MKIITICGSLKFENELNYYAEKLALEGNCVLNIIYPTKEKDKYTKEEIKLLGNEHLKKIELSDAIFVVNKNRYIGEAVSKEIEFARSKNKEVIYLESIVENDIE
jgi:hypothetical protein